MAYLIGTYTRDTGSDGIYLLEDDGTVSLAGEADNPSWLVQHPTLARIYAVAEVRGSGAADGGQVVVFDASDVSNLKPLQSLPSLGSDPCHLSINAQHNEHYLACTNYSSGSIITYPLMADGLLGDFESFVQLHGKGPDPMRQQRAHAHSSIRYADKLIVADLGGDKLVSYPVSGEGSLDTTNMRVSRLRAGAGPRHMAATRDERFLFVINELDNTISTLLLADAAGGFVESSYVSALPAEYTELSYTAQIMLSEDDKFLYGSNRGHDSICVFAIQDDGSLALIQHVESGGKHPRHFTLHGDRLLIVNRDSNNLRTYQRDDISGRLSQHIEDVSIPAPVCVLPV